jgi:predicted lipoprotein with Yx(FWY)xxD motif
VTLRTLLPVIGALGAAVVLAACGPDQQPSTAGPRAAETPATAAPGTAAATPLVLQVVQVEGFQPFVVNSRGRTIYRFDNDRTKPPASACLGGCAEVWEPVLAPRRVKIVSTAIDRGLVGTIVRPDGGRQLTLKGWPLYYFKDDVTLGQTAGYGKDGAWFAIAPDGSKARRTVSKPGTATDFAPSPAGPAAAAPGRRPSPIGVTPRLGRRFSLLNPTLALEVIVAASTSLVGSPAMWRSGPDRR